MIVSLCLLMGLSGCENEQIRTEQGAAPSMTPSAEPEATAPEPESFPTNTFDLDMDIDVGDITIPDAGFVIPQDSATFSPELAMQLLTLCSCHTEELTCTAFGAAGFETLMLVNYDKPADDPSHTCAWSLGKMEVQTPFGTRTVFLIAVRGTSGGEWYSNFDFAVSRDPDTDFAENFLFCAEDVFAGTVDVITRCEDPIIIICGHSRGAACANLLGVLYDEIYPSEQVFVYTYATPATVRNDAAEREYPNIFNVLNPCDIVPRLPLSAWGYQRAGTDIVLDGDQDSERKLTDAVDSLVSLAPDIDAYYGDRHSLDEAGLSENGLTVFEMMLVAAKSLTGLGTGTEDVGADMVSPLGISEESDFNVLFEHIEKLFENSGERAARLLAQHLPNTYMSLLQDYTG